MANREPAAGSAIAYCLQRDHVRWTIRIALVMGVVYTALNQADILIRGDATWLIWLKIPLNFLVPFLVANLGLLGARGRSAGSVR